MIFKQISAEFIGTFFLVFAGTGAIIINQETGGIIGHAGVSATFGLVILSLIYTFGDVSGAHFNPAVTFAFVAAKRFRFSDAIKYIPAQISGAAFASLTLSFLFPDNQNLGATLPSGSWHQSFILEMILTLFLMLVILSVSTGAKEKGIIAGIAIGSVVMLEAMFAGPITGASMNPARSIAPAIVGGNHEQLWIYVFATTLGALLAVPLCKLTRNNNCCDNEC